MPERMLVVEDDNALRNRLVRAFSQRGFETEGVESLDEARTAWRRQAPDAVVLDLRVGDESGLDLLEEFQPELDQIRVVVLSGYGTISTAVDSLKRGAVDFLTKPARMDDILRALGKGGSPKEEMRTDEPAKNPTLAQVSWEYMQKVLDDCGGNVSRAAKLLGLSRRSLQRKLLKSPGRLS